MRRSVCGACGSADLDTFLDLGVSPVADAYTSRPDEPAERYPLRVAVCGKCRLAQLLEVLDDATLFGTGYSFYTSASPPLSAYHAAYAADALARFGQLAARLTVELGCNDGDLLRHFAAAGCPTVGFDPAAGPAAAARRRGLDVAEVAFRADVAAELRDQLGPAGLVLANHVLAHVADVADFLAGVHTILADDGIAIIEVQYLPDLLVNNAFDLVYHEHRNFFSLTSLTDAAARQGLYVLDAELTDRQGGSVRTTLAKRRLPPTARVARIVTAERWLISGCAYEGVQGRAERIRDRLCQIIEAERAAGRSVAMYGAPAKATTLLSFCGLNADNIAYCVDSTPAKQGRHIPGTAIPILAPHPDLPRPDMYLLGAWNYAATIMANNPRGRWLLPIPAPVIL